MRISENGLRLIERFEGFVSRPYWDPYGRVWTRGFGETEGITVGSPAIGRIEAQERLQRLVAERYAPSINTVGGVNQNQFDALCSFVWNVGPGAVAPETTLGRLLRAHDWTSAANVLLAYTHAGGQVLPGLVARRQAERILFLTPVSNPLGVLGASERAAVEAHDVDARHPHLHHHRLAELRAELVAMRKAIWVAAERGRLPDGRQTQAGWGVENRARRYQLLLSRTR